MRGNSETLSVALEVAEMIDHCVDVFDESVYVDPDGEDPSGLIEKHTDLKFVEESPDGKLKFELAPYEVEIEATIRLSRDVGSAEQAAEEALFSITRDHAKVRTLDD